MKGYTLKGYSRYVFSEKGQAYNRQTEKAIKVETSSLGDFYRLTDDKGERKRIFISKIIETINEEIKNPKAPHEETASKVKKQKTPKEPGEKVYRGCFVVSKNKYESLVAQMNEHEHASILRTYFDSKFDVRGSKTKAIEQLLTLKVENDLIYLVCSIGAGTVYNIKKKMEKNLKN